MGIQEIFVLLLAVVAIGWLARHFFRTASGKGCESGCAGNCATQPKEPKQDS